MANDFFKNMPPILRSIWQLENELRRALQNAVLLRRDDAKQNLDTARRHMEAALQAVRGEKTSAKTTDTPEDATSASDASQATKGAGDGAARSKRA